jgi:hypothetical protein
MEFKRGLKSRSVAAERMTWESRCQRYRVIHSHIPYGFDKYRGEQHLGLPDVYYATVFTPSGWDIISIHRKRTAAQKACHDHQETRAGRTG